MDFRWLCSLLLLGPLGAASAQNAARHDRVFLEAERFDDLGGWVVDQQFMDQMGSPFLLAHGLGHPVDDARTKVAFPKAGSYRLWVRTRDWVAPWNVPGTPGKFQVLINGSALPTLFGTQGALWHWQDGGCVEVPATASVALHDLTGFEGRCDALLFSADPQFVPPEPLEELTRFRRAALGYPAEPENGGSFDLVVVGGGFAGSCAAITAARLGLTVALVQDRPVLGGNGSSEVRVWPEGRLGFEPYPHVGDVVGELAEQSDLKGSKNARWGTLYGDQRKLNLARSQPGLTLLLEEHVNAVDLAGGKLRAVVAQHVITGRRQRIAGRWFADCTGDGSVGMLAGAEHQIQAENHMGASNLWNVAQTPRSAGELQCECKDESPLSSDVAQSSQAVAFPECPWAINLKNAPFPGRHQPRLKGLGDWFWESGFMRDSVNDVEWMRDQNLRAMYGAWDTLKNVDKIDPRYRLAWAAYIAGKRESRRLIGDVILTADDILTGRTWEDPGFACTWSIDLHFPDKKYGQGHEGQEFISAATEGRKGFTYKGPYWVPYRCLFSRNVENLFMAGRDISVTHEALGAIRVMKTCGMMGEVVGMAAAVCKQQQTTPRGVYQNHLPRLQEIMKVGAGRPGK